MASTIAFKMNNLTIDIYGTGGYMDKIEYKNLDPVVYVFQITNRITGDKYNFHFYPTSVTEEVEGFRRARTDEVYATFAGAHLPNA